MGKYSLFIAAPIAGFDNEDEYIEFRKKMIRLVKKLSNKKFVGNITAEVTKKRNAEDYDTPEKSVIHDFKSLKESSHFVLIYPQKVVTSALVELGYAIALKKKVLIITPNEDLLPYLARELDKVYNNIKIVYTGDTLDNLDSIILDFI